MSQVGIEPIAVNIRGVLELTSLKATFIRRLTREDRIPHKRIGDRIVYPVQALREWIASGNQAKA